MQLFRIEISRNIGPILRNKKAVDSATSANALFVQIIFFCKNNVRNVLNWTVGKTQIFRYILIHHIQQVSWPILTPQLEVDNESGIRHVARISSRRGPAWRGPKAPDTKKRKLLGFSPLFFGSRPIHFYFLIFTMKFYFSAQGEMGPRVLPGYVPSGIHLCQ